MIDGGERQKRIGQKRDSHPESNNEIEIDSMSAGDSLKGDIFGDLLKVGAVINANNKTLMDEDRGIETRFFSDEILAKMLSSIKDAARADAAILYFLHEKPTLFAGTFLDPEFPVKLRLPDLIIGLEKFPLESPMVLSEIPPPLHISFSVREKVHSLIRVPLQYQGFTFALLLLLYRSRHEFSLEEVQVAENLAHVLEAGMRESFATPYLGRKLRLRFHLGHPIQTNEIERHLIPCLNVLHRLDINVGSFTGATLYYPTLEITRISYASPLEVDVTRLLPATLLMLREYLEIKTDDLSPLNSENQGMVVEALARSFTYLNERLALENERQRLENADLRIETETRRLQNLAFVFERLYPTMSEPMRAAFIGQVYPDLQIFKSDKLEILFPDSALMTAGNSIPQIHPSADLAS